MITRDGGHQISSRSTPSISMTPPPVDANDSYLCTVRAASTNFLTRMVAARHHPLDNPPSETRATYGSTHPFPLPYDILEIIIAHLNDDLCALKACSLTCRSWHSAAVPHLHHTFTLTGDKPEIGRRRLEPLSVLHKLGLIHLVKSIRVKQGFNTRWFVPRAFSNHDLYHFSAFANVHTLKLQNTFICDFIPSTERHFGHFSQSLRSITLYNPHCTPRQLSHFLSLFSNLGNIGIRNTSVSGLTPTIPEMELVPFSALKPRGRLALYNFNWAETWTHLITSNSDLRFRHMELRNSALCPPVLFAACAETLETLRFGVGDGSTSG